MEALRQVVISPTPRLLGVNEFMDVHKDEKCCPVRGEEGRQMPQFIVWFIGRGTRSGIRHIGSDGDHAVIYGSSTARYAHGEMDVC